MRKLTLKTCVNINKKVFIQQINISRIRKFQKNNNEMLNACGVM